MDIFQDGGWRKYTWIELTGFDRKQADYGVGDFLRRAGFKPTGVSLLLYWLGFVLSHEGLEEERPLSIAEDSYAAHPFAPERERQNWTNRDLKGLIDALHAQGIQVLLSYFNMCAFTDDAGNRVAHPFFDGFDQSMKETDREGRAAGTVNVLKRLPDGRFFSDVLIEKTVQATVDYGFDGVQIADGISSPRMALEQGDYSEDMIGQFAEDTGIYPPEDVSNAGAWIWENHRLDWIYFHTRRWEAFFRTFAGRLAQAGKFALFNSAWTRDPFEAMYRYGVDYRRVAKSGVAGCMVEDTSANLALLAEKDNHYLMTDEQRRRVHYEFLSVLMLNRAAMHDIAITPLAGIHDTLEQWGVLEHMPTAMTRNVMNNLCTLFVDERGARPVTDGPFFCLSDGLSVDDWEFIKRQWNTGAMEKIAAPAGVTLLWSDRKLDGELKAFVDSRLTPTHRLLSELLYAGAPIYSVARTEHIECLKGDVLATNPALLPPEEMERLMAYRGGRIFLLGRGAKRDGFFALAEEENSFEDIALTVNAPAGKTEKIENGAVYGFDPVKGMEKVKCLWTHPLEFAPVSDDFFLSCADALTQWTDAPDVHLEVISDAGRRRRPCKCVLVHTGENSARILLTNDDYYYNIPEVDLGREIRSVRCLTKYPGFRIPVNGTRLQMRVPGRGAEAIEVEFT